MKHLRESLLEISFILFLLKGLLSADFSIALSLLLITLVVSIVYTKSYLYKKKIEDREEIEAKVEEVKRRLDAINLSMGIKRSINESKK